MPGARGVDALMAGFLSAHGYDPGPTQRPLLTGAISGLVATIPALALLHLFGSLAVEAEILGVSVAATIAVGEAVMAAAGALYARLFGRAANNLRAGWLAGMAFGFVLWTGGAVMVLPLASGGMAPAGEAAIGVFVSLIAWGAALGLLVPFVYRPLTRAIGSSAQLEQVGPAAAATKNNGRGRRLGRDGNP
jgi:hypothetical protein